MIGETVIHYKILDKIGEGGMGVVYRAEDTRLGRQVAVKFLSSRLSQDASAIERFQREARAVSSLNHAHICALYDIGKFNDLPFLVMEMLSGSTLRRRISGTPLSNDLTLDLGAQIADALDAAHSAGIIHRDIKSANIYVTDRQQVKILDFGIAKLSHPKGNVDPYSVTQLATPADEATKSGETIGTVTYMSPEQARGDDIDTRSDLFSFGVVLYEMATGREPFSGKTSAMIFDAILNVDPELPSRINPKITPEIDHIIMKALEKDRDLRYQTAGEMRADLRRAKRESGSSRATRPTSRPTDPQANAAFAATVLGSGPASAPTMGQNTMAPTQLSSPTAVPGTTFGTPTVTGSTKRGVRPGLLALYAGLGLLLLAAGLRYFVGTDAIKSFVTGGSSSGGGAIDSIAVLPFATQAGAQDTEYLTDGITETLINGLAQLPELRVSARSVVFRYKGKDVDPQQVGHDLNVKTVVTGRVALRGDRLVIQAELMDVDKGTQLWGEQYNRPQTDLLAVQDQIAGEILDKLRPQLSGEDKKRATRQTTANSDAYQLYLKGRYHLNAGTIAGYRKAIDYFQQAIDKDPKYAQAYAGLADSNLQLGSYFVEAITEAKAAAIQAQQLDPSLAEAHVALGHIKLWLDWDWPGAEREFKQGISLNGSSAIAHNQYAMYLALSGKAPDAIAEAKRAQDLDPLSPIINSDLGWYQIYGGQYADAIAQFRKTLEFDPTSVAAHEGLGIAFSLQKQHDDAIGELKKALDLSENSPVILGHLGAAYARKGDKANADATVRELQAAAARQYVPSSALATIAAAEGDKTKALDLLEKAADEHDFFMAQIGVAPWFASLRDDARFKKLLTKIGR